MCHATFTTLVLAIVTNVAAQVQGTATVDLSKSHGPAQALGSGFIYGWPDNGTHVDTSIPDYLVTDIKFNANRGGGAQIPSLGWARGGYEGYLGRFNSTLSNYRTTRKYNADFILLPHDLWGADGGQGSNSPFPGDNGNWTEMELFWNQLVSDLKAHNMLDGLVIDVWNEPDIDIFWDRSWPQFLEYYNRATKLLRKALPGTLLSGPAMAHSPILTDDKWHTWLQSVSGNKTVPDRFSWHQIGAWEREPDTTIPDFTTLRAQYGVPEKPVDVNDGSDLHNWMGNLIYSSTGTSEGTYYPNGEWQVYKYYAAMTGQRFLTKASSDSKFDVFATKEGHKIKILAGTRTVQEKYSIEVSGLGAVELPKKGTVKVRTYRFDWAGPNGKVDGPIDLGEKKYTYSADTLTLSVNPPTNATAFAYEFSI
ncbi:uncharacterized protein FFUJ_13957 [Fusarium fujikuroi IMI 58289]|uniref:Beta-xylosidase n=1 Tax=Gibberella fujikuroi (strain CBS 195.34 / IMI 58289 / NRRL A-6831) TaxID=1279085 RepID=S0EDZ9_GIBF5|nr:uncharacterized protein FFUJ_13957 [Fusarium fujikuroi IMI 58289]CCT72047.1 uncharacterized protein FFUJ_13957 [Fusarium fujikuroi IMI 58289]SCO18066.1 uncharacterized protein FFM5_11733 [Fusarium fujikuroi]